MLYNKKYFIEKLKEAGLPNTYLTILRWEKNGTITRPKNMQIMTNGKPWRLYTMEEIQENINKIKHLKGL